MYYRRLKELRTQNSFTQKDIADHLKMPYQQYQRYENGTNDIPTQILKMIADFYHVSTDYILERTDKRR